MTAQREDPDSELLSRYREASARESRAPSEAVRAAILAEGRRVADLQRAAGTPAAGTPAALSRRPRRWHYTLIGTLSAAALAAFLVVPRWLAEPTPAPSSTPGTAPSAAPLAATAPAQADAMQEYDSIAPRSKADLARDRAGGRARVAAPSNAPAPAPASVSVSASANRADESGRSPLMIATLGGDEDAVRLLLERGADPNIADARGRTPLQEAERLHLTRIIGLLKQAGAH